jgi:hypothetical protein
MFGRVSIVTRALKVWSLQQSRRFSWDVRLLLETIPAVLGRRGAY